MSTDRPEILKPIAYTATEGSKWHPWILENITEDKLICCPIGSSHILLNLGNDRKHVHSIKFVDGRVWDCIHGWIGELG